MEIDVQLNLLDLQRAFRRLLVRLDDEDETVVLLWKPEDQQNGVPAFEHFRSLVGVGASHRRHKTCKTTKPSSLRSTPRLLLESAVMPDLRVHVRVDEALWLLCQGRVSWKSVSRRQAAVHVSLDLRIICSSSRLPRKFILPSNSIN